MEAYRLWSHPIRQVDFIIVKGTVRIQDKLGIYQDKSYYNFRDFSFLKISMKISDAHL